MQPQGGIPAGHPCPATERTWHGRVVCGLIGLVFSIIPFVGVYAWPLLAIGVVLSGIIGGPLVIIGIVLSAVGLSYTNSGKANNKGQAIAGLAVSIVGLFNCILWVDSVIT